MLVFFIRSFPQKPHPMDFLSGLSRFIYFFKYSNKVQYRERALYIIWNKISYKTYSSFAVHIVRYWFFRPQFFHDKKTTSNGFFTGFHIVTVHTARRKSSILYDKIPYNIYGKTTVHLVRGQFFLIRSFSTIDGLLVFSPYSATSIGRAGCEVVVVLFYCFIVCRVCLWVG